MTTNLPPGPWRNDSGPIRDAEGIIIADVYGRGDIPGSHSAIADLMIQAEREADPTPLDAEWLVSVGGECYGGQDGLFFKSPGDHQWFRVDSVESQLALYCPGKIKFVTAVIPVPTRGAFRTAMRMLGIQLPEPGTDP
jgi:hypothetical protein